MLARVGVKKAYLCSIFKVFEMAGVWREIAAEVGNDIGRSRWVAKQVNEAELVKVDEVEYNVGKHRDKIDQLKEE